MKRNRFRLPTFDELTVPMVWNYELRCVSGSLQMFVASFETVCWCLCAKTAPQRRFLRDTLLAQTAAYVVMHTDVDMESIKFEKPKAPQMFFFSLCNYIKATGKKRRLVFIIDGKLINRERMVFSLERNKKSNRTSESWKCSVIASVRGAHAHSYRSAHKHTEAVDWHNMDGAPMAQQHAVFLRLIVYWCSQ